MLSVACHPDGDAFATASSDSKVMLWDLRSQACAQTLSEHTDQARWSCHACLAELCCPCERVLGVAHPMLAAIAMGPQQCQGLVGWQWAAINCSVCAGVGRGL